MPTRRHFLLMAGGALLAARGERVFAQQGSGAAAVPAEGTVPQSPAPQGAANVAMDPGAYLEVRLPPKQGATPQLTTAQRDDLEHQIACACPCVLDVYTCRTTDFSCGISPAMHRDVLRLVEGGYTADEIIAAFVNRYGERVLMSPRKQGFNLVGYIMPFAALGAGALVLTAMIRRWGRRAAAPTHADVRELPVDASAEELARVSAAVRDDDEGGRA